MIGPPSLALLLAQTIAGGAAPAPAAPFLAVERPIGVARPGRVAVRLDREVYESAREDLGDLRVRDEASRLVPFLVDRGLCARRASELHAAIRNHGGQADGSTSAVLDFGGRVPKARLRLDLSGDNFRRRVAVEGSDDGVGWTVLVDEAWVFAIPGREPARYETVSMPENDFALLRVRVHPGEGERERPAIRDATLPALSDPPRREQALVPRWTRAEETRTGETWLTLDLGARWQPFRAVDLEANDERFFREARVEARRDASGPGRAAVQWIEIGRGAVYRLEHDGRRRECLRLDVSGRERVLRVRLRNGDDRPLAIRAVSVRAPVERVVFDAAAGRAYRLVYGAPDGVPPSFDLARTVADVAEWAEDSSEVPLGPVRRARAGAAPVSPWTERHPWLLWAGLLGVVAALGALTFRALRASGRPA